MAKYVKSIIFGGPPNARYLGFDHISLPGLKGRNTIDCKAWETCDPDEWLSIEVWDES